MTVLGRFPAAGWVVLFCIPALVPLGQGGFFESHDGLFHAYHLAALDRAVREGVLYPRWFPELAFGYGQPVLNFYGPLSYAWGLAFTLPGLDAGDALKAVFATGLVASALAMLAFARLHLRPRSAVVAALVYAALPYHLADLYVRGAVAEFTAFVWLPLGLWATERLIEQPTVQRLALAAGVLTALLTTHSLSALLFAPVLAGYMLVLLARRWRATGGPAAARRAAAWATGALALTACLSAFYWLPVLCESRFVGLGHGASAGYRDHLLPVGRVVAWSPAYPYPTEPGAAAVLPVGLAETILLAAAVGLLVWLWLRPSALLRTKRSQWASERRWLLLFFAIVAGSCALMMSLPSLPVWLAFERFLAYLQYPWRFQVPMSLALAVLAGLLAEGMGAWPRTVRWPVSAVIVLAVAGSALWCLPYTATRPDLSTEAMWQIDRQTGQVGATWTGEYLPIWVQEQRWAISHPTAQPASGPARIAAGQANLTSVAHTQVTLSVDAPQGATLVLHQFHYPGWQAHWQGRIYPSRPEGILGLAAFDLPPGSGLVTLRLAHTAAQRWGMLASLVCAVGMAAGLVASSLARRPGRLRHGRMAVRPTVPAAGCALLALVLLASLAWPNGRQRPVRPVGANLEGRVQLSAAGTDCTKYRAGERVSVTLYWIALQSLDQDLKSFVHLTDAEVTRQPTQQDGDPGGGFSPTSRWEPGELVPDRHYLLLPEDLAPGSYRLWGGMYEYPAVRNLQVLSAEAPHDGGRVLLGEIEVVAP